MEPACSLSVLLHLTPLDGYSHRNCWSRNELGKWEIAGS